MNMNIANISCLEELKVLARLQGVSMKEFLEKCKNKINVYRDLQYLVIGGKLTWFDRKTGKHVKPPKKIEGDFDCAMCDSLTSLEGAPKKVGESFYCNKCNSLASLEGSPKKIGGYFNCADCSSLKSLEGISEEIMKKVIR